jgi:hypothetical protein
MDIEAKLTSLEKELTLLRSEFTLILLDIRCFISEARSPLRSKPESVKISTQDDKKKGT